MFDQELDRQAQHWSIVSHGCQIGVSIFGGTQNGWFTRDNPIIMDDLRVPPCMETHKWRIHILEEMLTEEPRVWDEVRRRDCLMEYLTCFSKNLMAILDKIMRLY